MDDDFVDFSECDILRMTTEVVSAYLSNNMLSPGQIPEVIQAVHDTFTGLAQNGAMPEPEPQKPAVSIKRSIHPDYLICLEDGKRLKMLKRHLRSNYNMTPEEYREKWGLKADYPMVAPNYAAQRSDFAKRIGLGLSGNRKRS